MKATRTLLVGGNQIADDRSHQEDKKQQQNLSIDKIMDTHI